MKILKLLHLIINHIVFNSKYLRLRTTKIQKGGGGEYTFYVIERENLGILLSLLQNMKFQDLMILNSFKLSSNLLVNDSTMQ